MAPTRSQRQLLQAIQSVRAEHGKDTPINDHLSSIEQALYGKPGVSPGREAALGALGEKGDGQVRSVDSAPTPGRGEKGDNNTRSVPPADSPAPASRIGNADAPAPKEGGSQSAVKAVAADAATKQPEKKPAYVGDSWARAADAARDRMKKK